MRFAMNLANLRKKKNVSQRTAASALGVSQALLSHYENELREPGLEFLVNASRYYACSVDALLGVQPADSSESAANLPAEGSTAPRAAAALLAAGDGRRLTGFHAGSAGAAGRADRRAGKTGLFPAVNQRKNTEKPYDAWKRATYGGKYDGELTGNMTGKEGCPWIPANGF